MKSGKILATAACVVGLGVALAPAASAQPDDPYGFHDYRDRTDYMVTPFDSGAWFGDKANRPMILSPHGRSQTIECRGDGHYVAIPDCRQYDTAQVAHDLRFVPFFGRTVWVYF